MRSTRRTACWRMRSSTVLAACVAAHAWRQRRTVSVFEHRLFVALGLLALAIFYRESDLQSLLAPDSALRKALYIAERIVGPLLWLAAAIALWRCSPTTGCGPGACSRRMWRC